MDRVCLYGCLLHQAVCICMDSSFYLPPNLHVSDMCAIGSRATLRGILSVVW
jgi:hypothetical protein